MDHPDGAWVLHILGAGGVTALLLVVGYGVGRLAVMILEWIERG